MDIKRKNLDFKIRGERMPAKKKAEDRIYFFERQSGCLRKWEIL